MTFWVERLEERCLRDIEERRERFRGSGEEGVGQVVV